MLRRIVISALLLAGIMLSPRVVTPARAAGVPTVLVGAGKYEFGFQDGASMIIGRARGIPVKAIWCSMQQSPFAFITMPNSGITTVKQFRGKRIGYQPHQEYVLQTMLAHRSE